MSKFILFALLQMTALTAHANCFTPINGPRVCCDPQGHCCHVDADVSDPFRCQDPGQTPRDQAPAQSSLQLMTVVAPTSCLADVCCVNGTCHCCGGDSSGGE